MKFQGKLGVVMVVVQEQDTALESWKGKTWRREKKARVMPEEASKGEVKVYGNIYSRWEAKDSSGHHYASAF
jgi:hypothetical protein